MKIRTHTGSQRMNDGIQLFIFFDIGDACLFSIQHLTAQWKNRLVFAVSSLLGTASGRIPLDQIQLFFSGILALCARQLSG